LDTVTGMLVLDDVQGDMVAQNRGSLPESIRTVVLQLVLLLLLLMMAPVPAYSYTRCPSASV